VYYISNCNGVVLKDMALAGTGGDQGDTPTWNNINHRNVEILPQWSKLNINAQFSYEEIKENIDTVCPDRPPQLGNDYALTYFIFKHFHLLETRRMQSIECMSSVDTTQFALYAGTMLSKLYTC
jgi:hypothetical protein